MRLSAIRNFLAVAERGSLRSAARQLGIAQPAITRSVQELEKELGVVLFERRAKGVSLTPMGELFQRRASAVSQELVRAQDELAQVQGATSGTVRACLSTVAHMALLPNALKPFRQRYPDVRLVLVDALLPAVQQDLIDGTLDLYIGPVPEGVPSDLMAEKLFDNRRVVVARKGHPLAAARSLSELVGAQWATASITPLAEDEVSPFFAQHGLPAPAVVVQGRSAFTYLFSVAYSDLLMLLPVQWTQVPIFKNVLRQIEIEEQVSGPPICIVQRTGLPLTPAAETFCDMMRRASLHMATLMA